MQKKIPESKLNRSIVTGKTAISVSGKVLKYLAKKPFLSKPDKQKAKLLLEKDNAETIFKALVMLKGTALKVAQLLSFELDIIPPAIRKELEKSYNQVPPMNRAVVRKAIVKEMGAPPENVFKSFELKAFAAASLGQVHYAVTKNNDELAVKIQYPGIANTIKNDMQLVKNLIRPIPDSGIITPMLDEIQDRLFEEIDYVQEAENTMFFKKHLDIDGVIIPAVNPDFCSKYTLSTDFFDGLSLDQWIETNPVKKDRERIAGVLNSVFLKSLYELKTIHADPNPGNFLVNKELQVGLIDFGCVKTFQPKFVQQYQSMYKMMNSQNQDAFFNHLNEMNIINPDMDKKTENALFKMMLKVGQWYSKLYENEYFDFGDNKSFFAEGKKLMEGFFKFRKQYRVNPEFVFLDRTRYGLFRIFERLQAKVKIRNQYEC